MTEQRAKKDEYQKVLAAFGQAVKEFHKGDFDRAVEHLEGFIEKFPSEAEVVDRARMYLAIARKKMKKESPALKGFEDYCHYGIIRINQGDYEGAVKLLQKASEYKEKEGLVYYLLADVHCLMGQPEAGLDYLKKAVQKDKVFSTLAQNEPDFEPFWDDKKFKLITRMA